MCCTGPRDRWSSRSNCRIESTLSPKNSIRTGFLISGENKSTIPPRTENSPGAPTGSCCKYPALARCSIRRSCDKSSPRTKCANCTNRNWKVRQAWSRTTERSDYNIDVLVSELPQRCGPACWISAWGVRPARDPFPTQETDIRDWTPPEFSSAWK